VSALAGLPLPMATFIRALRRLGAGLPFWLGSFHPGIAGCRRLAASLARLLALATMRL